MRKKLLRSRSGFEKPESREEAIMQNILGASNVLEPSESNIEEILKSILYNTPYTKQAEFDIEKILLAIKNNGTYDGEHESRDLKILFAILNDLDYTEEAESRIEELFIEWLNQRSKVKVLEGIPPLTFVAKGEPLINYEISGNATQNGTPTPDNPIMPQGTGERTGNLFDKNATNVNNGYITNGFLQSDGIITTNIDYRVSEYIRIAQNQSYTLFYGSNLNNPSVCFYDSAKNYISGIAYAGQWSVPFTTPQNAEYLRLSFRAVDSSSVILNLGSICLPYEPYGIKIPISSANTTTPVYLGEVPTTRKIRKLVLTGKENFNELSAGLYRITEIGYMRSADTLVGMCSHFSGGYTVAAAPSVQQNTISFLVSGSGNNYIYFSPSQYLTISDFKSYLAQQYAAGTPVTVWYVLATEETGIVNEPLMKIGNYADTLSKAQAGVAIPTNNGSTTVDVDTTVKPSNIYIEYK